MTSIAKVSITPEKVNECKTDAELKDTLALGFKELSEFTNERDVAKAVIQFRASTGTIYRHLRGIIGALFFATELYKFMFQEVNERENLVAAA